jgi:hypothetical protein
MSVIPRATRSRSSARTRRRQLGATEPGGGVIRERRWHIQMPVSPSSMQESGRAAFDQVPPFLRAPIHAIQTLPAASQRWTWPLARRQRCSAHFTASCTAAPPSHRSALGGSRDLPADFDLDNMDVLEPVRELIPFCPAEPVLPCRHPSLNSVRHPRDCSRIPGRSIQ